MRSVQKDKKGDTSDQCCGEGHAQIMGRFRWDTHIPSSGGKYMRGRFFGDHMTSKKNDQIGHDDNE
jgi:hypothetical protein